MASRDDHTRLFSHIVGVLLGRPAVLFLGAHACGCDGHHSEQKMHRASRHTHLSHPPILLFVPFGSVKCLPPLPPPFFKWQLVVEDVDAVIDACRRSNLEFELSVEQPSPDWRYRIVKVRTPNGFEVLFEGEREDHAH